MSTIRILNIQETNATGVHEGRCICVYCTQNTITIKTEKMITYTDSLKASSDIQKISQKIVPNSQLTKIFHGLGFIFLCSIQIFIYYSITLNIASSSI